MQDRGWRNIFIAAAWLVLWYGLDRLICNEILFAGPEATLRALMRLLGTSEFYISVISSLTRIAMGFAAGAAVGIAAAVLGYRVSAVGAFLAPFVMTLKSTPVVSFVILLLIWAGNKNLSLLICLLVVAPILYLNTMSGLRAVDTKLLEMAQILHMPYRSRIRYIYIPQLRPNLTGALSLSLGMSWKSGVAAEVIGQPLHTIGNALYRSKIFFETADVFAWTLVIIVMSWVFERVVEGLLAGLAVQSGNRNGSAEHADSDAHALTTSAIDARDPGTKALDIIEIKDDPCFTGEIRLHSVTKSYDGKRVLKGITATLEAGGAYLLTGPSGSGKTTLLRIILGLESADEGEIEYGAINGCVGEKSHDGKTGYDGETSASAVFQEDRLCEEFSAVDNVAMIFKKPDLESIRRELSLLLPADELDKPVRELSGGMRRRVCIVRACMKPSELLAMDEPFNGLDAAIRDRCIAYMRSRQASRTLLIVSHSVQGLEFCCRMNIQAGDLD